MSVQFKVMPLKVSAEKVRFVGVVLAVAKNAYTCPEAGFKDSVAVSTDEETVGAVPVPLSDK